MTMSCRITARGFLLLYSLETMILLERKRKGWPLKFWMDSSLISIDNCQKIVNLRQFILLVLNL